MKHYPDGKLNDEDDGESAMLVRQENGRVVLAFPDPTRWIGMRPVQALALATALARHAQAILSGQKESDA